MNDPMPCQTCGKPHPRCLGHKRDGNPCGQPRMTGQRVCKMHGGMKPAARANGIARVKLAKANSEAVKLGFDVVSTAGFDPVEAMVRAVMKLEAMQEALSSAINSLEQIRYQGGAGEQLRAEITLYRQVLNDVVTGAERLAKLDLEGKRQAAADRYAGELVTLLTAVFTDLVLSEQQQERLPVVVSHHLGAVVSGQLQLEAGGAV